MTRRPTDEWRQQAEDEQAAIDAGTLIPDDAHAIHLWPAGFTAEADAALAAYEERVAALRSPSDDDVFAQVEWVVRRLNDIDEVHGRIETIEREELCEYIDDVLTDAGVDVDALTARRGVDRAELTDFWRDW